MACLTSSTSAHVSQRPGDSVQAAAGDGATVDSRPAAAAVRSLRANRVDLFLAANAALFVLMCVFAYWERWSAYMGGGRATEFVLFALAVVATILATRAALPRPRLPGRLLALLQVGILAHFAGGLVHLDGARLYDHVLAGVRYDKFVHAGNSFLGGLVLMELCRVWDVPARGFVRFLGFLAVLGLGAAVEIAEFAVTRTIPNHGIGGYPDTIGDLVANLGGGALFLAAGGTVERLTGLAREPRAEAAP